MVFWFFKYLFIYLFLAVLGLRFCARAFSSCGKRGPLLITARGPLTIAASPVAEHRLQMRRLSNCGSRAQSLRGTRDPPRPGLEPVSPALAGRFSTTAPPGKPCHSTFYSLLPSGPLCQLGHWHIYTPVIGASLTTPWVTEATACSYALWEKHRYRLS